MAEGTKVYVRKGCKSCGRALDYLREAGVDFRTVDLFKAGLGKEEVRGLFEKVGRSPRELLRTRDRMFRELGLRDDPRTDEELLDLMVQHPGLIQRPILVRGGAVCRGRQSGGGEEAPQTTELPLVIKEKKGVLDEETICTPHR